jgi:hypothetical protein
MFVDLWILIVAGLIILTIFFITLHKKNAPCGFQDKDGFHTYQDAYESAKQFSSDLAGELYNRLTEIEKLESESSTLRIEVGTQKYFIRQIQEKLKNCNEVITEMNDTIRVFTIQK